MKKKNLFKIALVLLATVSFNSQMFAQGFQSLDEAPHDISYFRESRATAPIVKIIYGRPQKNGEEIFGKKVAYGKIWRTGANEATEVRFAKDIMFGDVKVAAGTYVLYTVPGQKEWEIILSSNLDVLGAFQYDPIFDVARITVAADKAEELEVFSIGFKQKKDHIQMVLAWDTTRVRIPLKLSQHAVYANHYNKNILPRF